MLNRVGPALVILAASASVAQAQTPDGSDIVDRVLATVGDSVVLQTQVIEQVRQLQAADPEIPRDTDPDYETFFRDVLNTQVDRLVVLQAAAKDTLLQVDEPAVDRQVQERLDQLAAQFGTQAALQIQLQREGWTLGEYRDFLRNDARQLQIFQLYFQSRLRDARPVEITEDELQARFQEATAQLGQRPRLLTFQQVVVRPDASDSAKARARSESEALLERVRAGEDFAALAREHSDDVGTATLGGDLGWFRRGQMVQEFEEAAFGLGLGRVSPVVESAFGFHVIKVERVRGRSEIQARHILTVPETGPEDAERARAIAGDVVRRAQAGESMTALFEEFSVNDPLAPPDSVTIAFEQLEELPPAYGALRSVNTGDMVGPLEYQASTGRPGDVRFVVVKVVEVREAGAYTFEDLRTQLATQMQQERQRERILSELRERTYIEMRM